MIFSDDYFYTMYDFFAFIIAFKRFTNIKWDDIMSNGQMKKSFKKKNIYTQHKCKSTNEFVKSKRSIKLMWIELMPLTANKERQEKGGKKHVNFVKTLNVNQIAIRKRMKKIKRTHYISDGKKKREKTAKPQACNEQSVIIISFLLKWLNEISAYFPLHFTIINFLRIRLLFAFSLFIFYTIFF